MTNIVSLIGCFAKDTYHFVTRYLPGTFWKGYIIRCLLWHCTNARPDTDTDTRTCTNTRAHIHKHTFTHTHSHAHSHTHKSTREHALTRTYIRIHADANPTYRAFVPAHELREENIFRAIWMLFCAMWMSQGTHEWITAHVWRSHGTHMKESWYRAFVPAHKLLNGNAILRLLHHLQCLRMCVCERTFDFLDMIYVKMYCVCVRLYLRI